MRALQISTWHQEAQLVEVDEPIPTAGQVVIKIGAAGACHSDLHMMHGKGDTVPFSLPFTLGHENAGWVHSVGDGVTSVEPGQPVAVYGAWGCGACVRCRVGMENYCEAPSAPLAGAGCGLGLDGGMADYMLVPDTRHLLPIPDGLSPVEAAPLTDAGVTPYHAVRRSLQKLGPTSTAVVIGVGGLGHLAIQILKATSSTKIIAIDTKRDALDLALTLGADVAFESGDGTVRDVKKATGKRGADLVLDCVGTDTTLTLGAACTRSLGDLTLVGVAGGSMAFSFLSQAYEVSLQSVYWGSRSELVEVLELASRGLIRPQIKTYSLDGALDAYRALAAGQVAGRAVIIPDAPS
jgi:alcohol dehydrogenase, propanol-preferring